MRYLKFTIISLGLIIGLGMFKVSAEEAGKMDSELLSCLEKEMGKETVEAIKSGARQPTAEDGKKGETCFKQYGSPIKQTAKKQQDLNFSDQTAKCMEKTLGANYKEQFQKAGSESEGRKLAEKAKSCFGGSSGEQGKIPDEVKQCITNTIGETEANKMFGGNRPDQNSEVYKKIESAGCFKNMGRDSKGKIENIPEDKRKCIEGIMGQVNAEPTEEQKQQVGAKCFGDSKKGESSRQRLPEAVESCLKEKVGASYQDKSPGNMTAAEKNGANECFQKYGFRPEGGERAREEAPPAMNDGVKSCIERVTGQSMSGRPTLSDDQKNAINSQCFSGKADEITGEGGARGKNKEEQNSCVKNIAGDNPGPYTGEIMARLNSECYGEKQNSTNSNPRATDDKQACVARLSADTSVQMTYEEKQAQINKECFFDLNYGKTKDEAYDSSRSGSGDNGTNVQQSDEQRGRRSGESEGGSGDRFGS